MAILLMAFVGFAGESRSQNIGCSGNGGVNFVGSINGYAQPVNCAVDYRVLNYRRFSVTSALTPTDGRGQWKTVVNVQSSGGNVSPSNMPGGSGNGFLFTNGGNCGATGQYSSKWVFGGTGQGAMDGVNGTGYYTSGGTDMGLDMSAAGYYTFVLQDAGCANANFYVGKTTAVPVTLTHTSPGQRTINADGSATITVSLNVAPSPQENFFIRYRETTNDFSASASLVQGIVSGTTVTATIPAQTNGALVYYHIFSSTRSLTALNGSSEGDRSLSALNFADSSGNNFRYTCVVSTRNWTGNVSTDWHNPNNWIPALVPTQNDNAIIANLISGRQPLISNANAVCRNLTIGSVGVANSLTMSNGRLLQVYGATFTNNGNFLAGSGNEIVEFMGPVTINGTNPTQFNNATINNATTFIAGTIPNIIGVFTLNPGSFVNTAPNYGSSSRLNYNIGGAYNVGAEWTGTNISSGLGNPNDVSINGGTILNMPASARGMAGTMFITNGTLQLNSSLGGDLYVGKDWQRTTGTGFFNPNSRAVWFRGFVNQEIRVLGGGTETFNYLVVDKPISGTYLRPSNTAGSQTNIRINGMAGDILQLINVGQLDINGRTFTLDGNDTLVNTGNIYVNGVREIVNSAPGGVSSGVFAISGTNNFNRPTFRTKSVRNNSGTGRLVFDSTVVVTIADGMMDFGSDGTANLTTIEGVLQVNLGGSVFPYSCFYSGPSPASILRFANTIDYQVNSFDKTWSQGAIYSGLPGIPWNVEIINTNTDLTINDVRALRNNLTIIDGRFTLLAGPFNIGGSWTRVNPSGSVMPPCAFIPNTNKVVFDKTGAGDQIITCTADDSVETYYELEVSPATANVRLAPRTDVVVTNGLLLTTGKLDLNDDTLTLGYDGFAGTLTGGGLNSYILGYKSDVNGIFRRFTPALGTYSFPFGDTANFTPISIALTGGAFGPEAYIDGSLYDETHPNMSPFTVYINRFWRMRENSLINPQFNADYRYVDNDVVGNEATILPYRFDTSWVGSGGSNAAFIIGAGSNNTAVNQLTWNGMTSFGDFTGVGEPITLPVAMLYFSADPEGNDAIIRWTTATEINNEFFTVERSWNGIDFEPVHLEPGAGNSNTVLHYSYLDRDIALAGRQRAYYRIKQTDYDGKFTYSETAVVSFSAKRADDYTIFPNPFSEQLVIVPANGSIHELSVEIIDATGKLVATQRFNSGGNENLFIVNGLSGITSGVYTLRIIADDQVNHTRVIKK